MLSAPRPCPPDLEAYDGPGWAPVAFRDDVRSKDRVVAVHALGLDFDKGGPSLDRVLAGIGAYACIVHGTRRFTPDSPRWRAIVRLSRPMTLDSHALVWATEQERLAEAGLQCDLSTKDASRLWFLPTVPQTGPYVVHVHPGRPLDVAAAVQARQRELARRRDLARSEQLRTPPLRGGRYAQAALRRECEAVAAAPLGERNVRLNRAAYSLARFVALGELGQMEVTAALASAAHIAGLAAPEVAKTIASGIRSGGRR
jgi:hypothetical protein